MSNSGGGDVSATRLYLGNLPRTATKHDVETHFANHGPAKIQEIKLMNGFGFIEYEDAMDARDVVPAYHGSTFMGERMVVQFARGARKRDDAPSFNNDRSAPRPRRTLFRMSITNLPTETSWQDLKDFARSAGTDVVYSEVGRERDGRGFVEYETKEDLMKAVEELNDREFKGNGIKVHCIADEQVDRPRDRYRSRSPARGRYAGGPPRDDYRRGGDDYYYDRAPRDEYRRRTPPPRDPYYPDRDRYARPPSRGPPQRRGPPGDDYPPRPRYEESYGPPRYDDQYSGSHGGGRPPYGGGPPSPRRRSSPGRPPVDGPYEPRPRYWYDEY